MKPSEEEKYWNGSPINCLGPKEGNDNIFSTIESISN